MRIAFIMSRALPTHVPFFNRITESFEIDLWVCSDQRTALAEPLKFSPKVSHRLIPGIEIQLSAQTQFSYFITPKIWKILPKYDLLIVGGYHLFPTQIAMLWAKTHRVPYVLWCESHFHRSKKSSFLSRIKMPIVSAIVRNATSSIAVSSWAKEFLQFFGASSESIFTIPYIPDPKFFGSLKIEKSKLRSEIGIPDLPTVIFVGRLVRIKGVQFLIEAINKLNEKLNLQLLIIGEGENSEDLRRIAKKNVHFVGAVRSSDLRKFYCASDLFVLPSIDEPFGAVVLEAMACGLPVIVSDRVGSGADFVFENENGKIVRSGDSTELASAISEILSDQLRLRKMSSSSIELMRRNSIEDQFDTFCEMIEFVESRSLS